MPEQEDFDSATPFISMGQKLSPGNLNNESSFGVTFSKTVGEEALQKVVWWTVTEHQSAELMLNSVSVCRA